MTVLELWVRRAEWRVVARKPPTSVTKGGETYCQRRWLETPRGQLNPASVLRCPEAHYDTNTPGQRLEMLLRHTLHTLKWTISNRVSLKHDSKTKTPTLSMSPEWGLGELTWRPSSAQWNLWALAALCSPFLPWQCTFFERWSLILLWSTLLCTPASPHGSPGFPQSLSFLFSCQTVWVWSLSNTCSC